MRLTEPFGSVSNPEIIGTASITIILDAVKAARELCMIRR